MDKSESLSLEARGLLLEICGALELLGNEPREELYPLVGPSNFYAFWKQAKAILRKYPSGDPYLRGVLKENLKELKNLKPEAKEVAAAIYLGEEGKYQLSTQELEAAKGNLRQFSALAQALGDKLRAPNFDWSVLEESLSLSSKEKFLKRVETLDLRLSELKITALAAGVTLKFNLEV